ncbi:MAG: FtsQ-type POTRA domain-containing protein [Pseudomonadota bacterium]
MPKKRNRNVRGGIADHGKQPVYTARAAVQRQKRGGLVSRIGSLLKRSARRKELKRVPAVAERRTPRGVIPVCLLVFVVSSGFLLYSPLVDAVSGMNIFRIQEISISGCRKTSPAMIRELAGIRYQTSLVRLNPEHIAAILRTHPWIAAVEVGRDWPDAVVVSIKEYMAEALITQDVPGGRQFFYLDKSGVVFAPVEPGQDMDLPVITGLEKKGNVGQRRPDGVGAKDDVSGDDGRSEMISEALALLKLVRQNNPNLPLQNLSEIHVDRDAGMIIYLADYPFPIYFGAGAVRTKYSRLKRVLEVLYKETERGMTIADVAYIRMDYLENKVLVAHSGSG